MFRTNRFGLTDPIKVSANATCEICGHVFEKDTGEIRENSNSWKRDISNSWERDTWYCSQHIPNWDYMDTKREIIKKKGWEDDWEDVKHYYEKREIEPKYTIKK